MTEQTFTCEHEYRTYSSEFTLTNDNPSSFTTETNQFRLKLKKINKVLRISDRFIGHIHTIRNNTFKWTDQQQQKNCKIEL